MTTLYTLGIIIYGLAIRIAAVVNPKAEKWVKGRQNLFRRLEESLNTTNRENGEAWKGNVWFHCASLGEFEQGRPVIEGFRELYPEYRIILTFYSPSGYEVKKNYKGAEGIFYMPLDTPANTRRWIRILNPKLIFFVKYEYWFNFLAEIKRKNIPVFIISAIFHQDQPFFKGYGGWFKKQLENVSWFFLQGEGAKTLAESLGIKNFTITGDTRFDRVWSIREQPEKFPLIEKFSVNTRIFLGGSTWEPDETVILRLIMQDIPGLKFIIAPHEVHASRIQALVTSWQLAVGSPQSAVRSPQSAVGGPPLVDRSEQRAQGTEHRAQGTEHRAQGTEHRAQGTEQRAQGTEQRAQGNDSLASGIRHPASAIIRYSDLTPENAAVSKIVIIDTIGILARLYQYATVSMIGGGFGAGIHNILEAAAFGNPVIFGPNFHKFTEARELIQMGGAFSIKNEEALITSTKDLLDHPEAYIRASSICRSYVEQGRGATRRILQGIQTLGFIGSPRKNQ